MRRRPKCSAGKQAGPITWDSGDPLDDNQVGGAPVTLARIDLPRQRPRSGWLEGDDDGAPAIGAFVRSENQNAIPVM